MTARAEGTGSLAHVEVVVPIHTARRPIARAVRSVLQQDGVAATVRVVCHGVPTAEILDALGPDSDDSRVVLSEYRGESIGPAGPVNAGLDAADADWVLRLDSDDELEAGALTGMVDTARRTGADVVLPVLVRDDGIAPSPRPRPGRFHDLDPVRDRLAYRTHSFALIRRDALDGVRMTEGVRTGEDLEFVTRLWFSAPRIALHAGPGYRLHGGASDRITQARRTVAEDLRAVVLLIESPWWSDLPARARRAIGTKLLRNHVLPTFLTRPGAGSWSSEDVVALNGATRAILRAAPGADRPLSVAESRLLGFALASAPDLDAAHSLARRPKRLLEIWATARPTAIFERDAPLRMNLAARAFARTVRRARAS